MNAGRYARIFWLVALVTWVPFAVNYLMTGRSIGLLLAVAPAVVAGWALVLVTRKGDSALIAEGIAPGDYPARVAVSLRIRAPFPVVTETLVDALRNVGPGTTILTDNRQSGHVVARTKITSLSWGEVIEGRISKLTGSLVRLELTSRPRLWTVVADLGRNYRNLVILRKTLYEALGSTNVDWCSEITDAEAS